MVAMRHSRQGRRENQYEKYKVFQLIGGVVAAALRAFRLVLWAGAAIIQADKNLKKFMKKGDA
ncbi:MAG TPA: hypothetical protein PLX33_07565 [Alphaproteobacteria bacterium]|nr:hypothetical protein [Alphaproteobacteria bacterium]